MVLLRLVKVAGVQTELKIPKKSALWSNSSDFRVRSGISITKVVLQTKK